MERGLGHSLLAILLTPAVCFAMGSATPEYTIDDLGPVYPRGGGINDLGDIVGDYQAQGPSGSYWTTATWKNGVTTQLPVPVQSWNIAAGINGRGDVATNCITADMAFLISGGVAWNVNTITTNSPYKIAEVKGINNFGEMCVTGKQYSSTGSSYTAYTFFWSGGKVQQVGTNATRGTCINDHGEIAGQNGYRPFLWRQNELIDLGFPTPVSGTTISHCTPYAMNNRYQIVGSTYINSKGETPTIWTRDIATGRWVAELLDKTGTGWGMGKGVNDFGVTVGNMWLPGSQSFPFVHTKEKGVRKLDDLVPLNSPWRYFTNGSAINNRGQIATMGLRSDGRYHGVRLTPIVRP